MKVYFYIFYFMTSRKIVMVITWQSDLHMGPRLIIDSYVCRKRRSHRLIERHERPAFDLIVSPVGEQSTQRN